MAEVPKRPWAAKVWRSAVMPAPEEGSWPAMVRRVRWEAAEIGRFAGTGGQPEGEKTLSYVRGFCNPKTTISAFQMFDLGYSRGDNI
jgi:hypothetical protein